jgi:hypothetical protein
MEKSDLLKLGLETGLLMSSALFFFHSHSSLKRDSKILDFLQHAYEFNPKTLIEVLEENITDSLKKNFLKFEQDESFSKVTAFIKGRIFANNLITSHLDKSKRHVSMKLTIEPIFSNTNMIDTKDIFVKRQIVKDFLLNDTIHSNNVLVKNLENVDFDFALKKIASKTEFRDISFISRIFPNLIKLIQFAFSILRLHPHVKGLKVGHRISEYGIGLHQAVVMMGRMIYDKRNKILIMDKPKYILQEKSQLVSSYKSRIIRWGRLKLISVLLVAIFTFLSLRRFLKMADRIKQYIRNAKDKFQMEKLKNLGNILPDEFKCIICIENPKNVIFKPCLHMAICKTCCQMLDKRVCPICKVAIKDTVNIFVI